MHDDASDLPTVLSIAVLAYMLANLVHEGLGHGGVCLALGGHATALNAIYFDYDAESVSSGAVRWIAAGGTLANLAIFAATAPLLRLEALSAPLRYFVWLYASLNLLQGCGYLLFSGVLGLGDWVKVFDGLASPLVLRAGLTVVGALLYFVLAPRLVMAGLEPFLGRDREGRARRVARLVSAPYYLGSAAIVLAGLLNPLDVKLVLISAAAASFGGTSLLAWYPGTRRDAAPSTPERPIVVNRSVGWIAGAALAYPLFLATFARGIAL